MTTTTAATATATEHVVPEWLELFDPQSNRIVYANTVTGECSWTRPDFAIKARDPTGEWWELMDEETGVPYYYNSTTGATEWEPPGNATVVPFHALLTSSVGKRLSMVVANRGSIAFTDEQADSLVRKASRASLRSGDGPLSRKSSLARSGSRRLNHHRKGSSANNSATLSPEVVAQTNAWYGLSNGMSANDSSADSPPALPGPASEINTADTPVGSDKAVSLIDNKALPTPTSPVDSSPKLTEADRSKSDFIVDARSKLESGHRPTPVGDKPKDRELHRLSAQRHSQSETALETLKEALAATNFSSQAEKTKADGGSHDEEDDFFDVGASVGGSGGGSGLASGPGHVDGYRKSEHTNRTAAPATTGRPRNHSELPRKADQSAERYKSLDYYPFDPSHPIGKHNHRNRSMPSIHADSGLYGMRVFANSQFAAQKRGFLRRKVPLEEMISYTNETIARPLMNLPREMTRDAVRSFRAIQRYMGDIDEDSTFEENFAEVLWLANQGIRHQMLRDEVFCQIAKQVTGNPDASAAEKGWALMGVLLYAFRPTQLLLPHLEAFIDATAISSTYLKRFLKLQINRVKRTGSRTSQMSKKELRLAMTVPSRPMIFGATLAEIMGNKDLIGRDSGLPLILEQLTQLITKLGGERTEGLFRVPGDSDAVSIARLQIEAGQPDFSSIHDPNIPASLLKEWLRDLAEPLMPESMYEACIEKPDDPQAVQSILYMLPDSSYQVVKYILGFLSHLLQPNIRDATKMDSSNLALVFGPSFLRNPVSDLKDVFANSSREQKFVMTLLESFMDS